MAIHGERLHVGVRLIIAPRAGTFSPAVLDGALADGLNIAAGQAIGRLVHSGEDCVVQSPFSGVLKGLLASPGERVRPGQPVAWLAPEDDHMSPKPHPRPGGPR
jgi:hypothetical protein